MAAPQSSLRGGGGLQFEEEETQIWGRKGFETLGETEPVETQEGGLKVASIDPQRSLCSAHRLPTGWQEPQPVRAHGWAWASLRYSVRW